MWYQENREVSICKNNTYKHRIFIIIAINVLKFWYQKKIQLKQNITITHDLDSCFLLKYGNIHRLCGLNSCKLILAQWIYSCMGSITSKFLIYANS